MSSIIGDRPLLVGGGDSLCKFQMMDGTYEESDVSFKILFFTKEYTFFSFCRWATERWNGTIWLNMMLWAKNIGILNLGNWIITYQLTNLPNSDLRAKRKEWVTVV